MRLSLVCLIASSMLACSSAPGDAVDGGTDTMPPPLDAGADRTPREAGGRFDASMDAVSENDGRPAGGHEAGVDAGPPLPPCTKYVSTSGALDGGTTYTTIADALAALAPGDSLCIAPGTYQEIVHVTTSGTAAQPITLRALDPSHRPLIDGAYALPPGPPDTGGSSGCYEYAAGLDLGYTYTNVDPNANLGPPPKKACAVAHGPQGGSLVSIEANHVHWDGIDVTRSRGAGVLLGNATGDGWYVWPLDNPATAAWYTDISFRHSKVNHTRSEGVFCGVYADTIVFDGNDVSDAGNAADYDHSTDGYGWPGAVTIMGKNVVVTNNIVHESYTEGIGVGASVFQCTTPSSCIPGSGIPKGTFNYAQDLLIAHNTVYDTWSERLYLTNFDGATVDANLFYSVNPAYYYGGPKGVPVVAVNVRSEVGSMPNPSNLVFSNNIILGTAPLLELSPYPPEATYTNLAFYNNTLLHPYQDGAGIANELTPGKQSGVAFVNNLAYTAGSHVIDPCLGFNNIPGVVLSNNAWSSNPAAVTSAVHEPWCNDLANPQMSLSGSGDVVASDLGLSKPTYEPSAGSFDTSSIVLAASSVARGAGAHVALVTDDFFGTKRPAGSYEIGAYQHP